MSPRAAVAAMLYGLGTNVVVVERLDESVPRDAVIAVNASSAEVHALASRAEELGLALVEPAMTELDGVPLAFQRTATAADRALFSRVLFGDRPLVFVARASAPKNGLPKVRRERCLDAVVSLGERASAAPLVREARPGARAGSSLVEIASAILRETPGVRGKELLRLARDRFKRSSTSDSADLASAIYSAWLRGEVELELA